VALGLAAGFVGSLLRRRSPGATSGYVAPVPADGPQAVPPPALHIIRFPDEPADGVVPAPGDVPAPGLDPGPGPVLRIRLPGDTAVG
jgi:hypothetical protein